MYVTLLCFVYFAGNKVTTTATKKKSVGNVPKHE